ncbi:hypothetical protein [Streptomyces sp. NRRL F-5630]|uniref:hypothetical protein n=1 Tax=Streptomyces sp. NRRL F-5630 TaxID=1463864 RepID=UPI003EC08F41
MSRPFGDNIGSFGPMNLPDMAGGAEEFTAGAGAGAAVPGGGANRDISASPVVPLPSACPAAGPSQARTL